MVHLQMKGLCNDYDQLVKSEDFARVLCVACKGTIFDAEYISACLQKIRDGEKLDSNERTAFRSFFQNSQIQATVKHALSVLSHQALSVNDSLGKILESAPFLEQIFNLDRFDETRGEVLDILVGLFELIELEKYDFVGPFFEGLARVEKNGEYGFINPAGEEVITCGNNSVDSFSEGLAGVEKNGEYGFINPAGEEVITCEYDFVDSFSEGLASVEKNGKYYILKKK